MYGLLSLFFFFSSFQPQLSKRCVLGELRNSINSLFMQRLLKNKHIQRARHPAVRCNISLNELQYNPTTYSSAFGSFLFPPEPIGVKLLRLNFNIYSRPAH